MRSIFRIDSQLKKLENNNMCRLFGFKSIINSQVHSSLVSADNTLHDLSQKHPDGWGVAYYLEKTPHLIKSIDCAMEDHIFQKVSGVVSSQTVIAHIRKATQGTHTILNSHPFQYGKWIFAHNGNIKNFEKVKEDLLKRVDPDLKRYILGTTDSEIFFFILLTELKKKHPLDNPEVSSEILIEVVESTVKDIVDIIGKLNHNTNPVDSENYLTFIFSSGSTMLAFNGGQDLHCCTYKTSCPEKDSCPSFAPCCEAPPGTDKKVNHLIFSSELISGPNYWEKLKKGEVIGVDSEMKLFKKQFDVEFEN